MDDATSAASAPITGATAAMAEFPQIALPVATRIARRRRRPSARAINTPSTSPNATIDTIATPRAGPARSDSGRSTEIPRIATDSSSTCLPANRMPGSSRAFGRQTSRTIIPTSSATTSASMTGDPKSRVSTRAMAMDATATAAATRTPGATRRNVRGAPDRPPTRPVLAAGARASLPGTLRDGTGYPSTPSRG